MALFGKKTEGGMMDVIRCDEQEYLIWKWTPKGQPNSTKKENAIRWGSSLRVKDGEVAVFVYNQEERPNQDFIIGPHDESIKTANFPVISKIIGSAYAGNSPFQAEVYFINLAGNIQLKFGVPYFNIYDPRFTEQGVPVAARGTITFNITDYKSFIKLQRLITFEMDDFKFQIKDALKKYVKGILSNIPFDNNIPVLQLERKILEINDLIEPKIKEVLEADFGVNMKRFDLGTIEFDKESSEYKHLLKVTREQQEKTTLAQTDINITNLEDTQRINADNVEDTLRIQREEMQRAQKLTTESQNISAHQLNQQTEVAKTAAKSMGEMGSGGSGGSGGGMMDPGSMMASMAMGGAVGSGMAGAVGGMMDGMNQQKQTPPPSPQVQYNLSINGQQSGPFNWQQLQAKAQSGELNKETHVWKAGMGEWELAGNVQELASLFAATPPPPPPSSTPPPAP